MCINTKDFTYGLDEDLINMSRESEFGTPEVGVWLRPNEDFMNWTKIEVQK